MKTYSITLTQKEVMVLTSCIYMALCEGLYQFDNDGLDAGEQDIKDLLIKFGMDDEEAQNFIRYAY